MHLKLKWNKEKIKIIKKTKTEFINMSDVAISVYKYFFFLNNDYSIEMNL